MSACWWICWSGAGVRQVCVSCNLHYGVERVLGNEVLTMRFSVACLIASRKALTWKYYAKKILYYLRQQKILNNLKAFLQQPDDYESYLEGGSVCDCGQGSLAAEQPLRACGSCPSK